MHNYLLFIYIFQIKLNFFQLLLIFIKKYIYRNSIDATSVMQICLIEKSSQGLAGQLRTQRETFQSGHQKDITIINGICLENT